MEQKDYLKVKDINLIESGLVSLDDLELMKFMSGNKINTVGDLLVAFEKFNFKKFTHTDTFIQIFGLVDLLKFKYFNVPLTIEPYLKPYITEKNFMIYGDSYSMLAIDLEKDKSENIYTAITRIGFSDKERWIILDRKYKNIENRRLIDIFKDVYDELKKKDKLENEEEVLYNKLLLILDYCKMKDDLLDRGILNLKIQQLNELIARKKQLESSIETLKQQISELNNSKGGISK